MGLDTVEFLLQIEEEFSIEIPSEDAEKLGIVGDIARYIVKNTNHSPPLTFEYVLKVLINILSDNYRVPRQNINSTSHVVDDLHLD